MSTSPRPQSRFPKALETVEPIGLRVLVSKDEDKKQTRAGIHLPDKIEIPTHTGRIVPISAKVAADTMPVSITSKPTTTANARHGNA
mgnify:CR=1 FL=1